MTPADLAEGRRLLETATAWESAYPRWLCKHGAALIAEAEAAARLREEAARVLREHADDIARVEDRLSQNYQNAEDTDGDWVEAYDEWRGVYSALEFLRVCVKGGPEPPAEEHR